MSSKFITHKRVKNNKNVPVSRVTGLSDLRGLKPYRKNKEMVIITDTGDRLKDNTDNLISRGWDMIPFDLNALSKSFDQYGALVRSWNSISDAQQGSLDPDLLVNKIMALKPRACADHIAFKWDYLEQEIVSKLARPGCSAEVRAQRAVDKMLDADSRCKNLNEEGFGCSVPRDYFENVMLCAQRIIADILGDFSFDMFEYGAFGAGASTHRLRSKGDPYFKYNTRDPLGVTPACYKYAWSTIVSTPLWCQYDGELNLQLTAGNSVFTVPKKTDIDRAACKEPCMNQHLQRAVGIYIRTRLRSQGVNLDDQTFNQTLARLGSMTGELATIDLSAASDSISQRLIFELLPEQWVTELDKLRSPRGVLPDGSIRTWNMHSTMGNGYTFELESLIFYAVSLAVFETEGGCRKDDPYSNDLLVTVYGDDIIVPSYMARSLIAVLRDLGFDTNTDKTFFYGPFRESCGKHYYEGIDVSPFYIRKFIDTPQRVIWLLNALRAWAANGSEIADELVHPLWLSLRRKFVPSFLLGGSNMRSVTSVASPEPSRCSLQFFSERKQVNGPPAVLRALQYQNRGWGLPLQPLGYRVRSFSPSIVKWYDKTFDDWYRDTASTEYVDVMTSKDSWDVVPNESQYVDFAHFPKEMCT